jgi:hypothetical protein
MLATYTEVGIDKLIVHERKAAGNQHCERANGGAYC